MSYLALGDSYTVGEGVSASERWPDLLAAALRSRGMDLGAPQIIAKTGWTTDELSAAIDAASPTGPFNLVTLLIGVNDQYRGRPVDDYRRELVALLHRAIGFAAGNARHVVVVSIPDWSVTRFAAGLARVRIAAEIDRYNAVGLEESKRAGTRYVDITPISRENPSLVAGDGLHPSGAMYARWVESVLPEAIEVVS